MIRVVIVGSGASARTFHLPLIRSLNEFKIEAIVEPSGPCLSLELPGAASFKTLDEFLARERPKDFPWLAVICSPNEFHAEQAAKCLEAGLHVVVEKPFTFSEAEARALIATAKRKDRLISVFQSRRFDGDFLTLTSIINSGRLGLLKELEIRYERWSPALRPKAWKEKNSPGSSLLEDLGSHLLDQALRLFGPPHTIFAQTMAQRPESRVTDAFWILLSYPGLSVVLRAGMLVRESLPHIIANGSEGSFVKFGMDPQESQLKEGMNPADPEFGIEDKSLHGTLHGASGKETIVTEKGRYRDYYETLAKAIANGSALPVEAEDAALVVALLEAARESAESGRVVTFRS